VLLWRRVRRPTTSGTRVGRPPVVAHQHQRAERLLQQGIGDVGLDLRDTKLVIFGSPSALTPVIAAAPLAALDLPLRVVAWEDGCQTLVSYPAPAAVARRYGLAADLANALASIDALTSAVIDR
jgi:uncharacterized protein (DUF302 family)